MTCWSNVRAIGYSFGHVGHEHPLKMSLTSLGPFFVGLLTKKSGYDDGR